MSDPHHQGSSVASTSFSHQAEQVPNDGHRSSNNRALAHILPSGSRTAGNDEGEGGEGDDTTRELKISDQDVDGYKEQDRFLPIANVGRVMKKVLPSSTKVSKESKEVIQECTSEFISFITSEAAERCNAEKRKTVTGEDILFAMNALGFENYAEVMKIYLSKWRALASRDGKKRERKRSAYGSTSNAEGDRAKKSKAEDAESGSTPRSAGAYEDRDEEDDDDEEEEDDDDEEEGEEDASC